MTPKVVPKTLARDPATRGAWAAKLAAFTAAFTMGVALMGTVSVWLLTPPMVSVMGWSWTAMESGSETATS